MKADTNTTKNILKSQPFNNNNNNNYIIRNNYNNKLKSDFPKQNTFINNFSKNNNEWEKKSYSNQKSIIRNSLIGPNDSKHINNMNKQHKPFKKNISTEKYKPQSSNNINLDNLITESPQKSGDLVHENIKEVVGEEELKKKQEEDKQFELIIQDLYHDFTSSNNPKQSKNQYNVEKIIEDEQEEKNKKEKELNKLNEVILFENDGKEQEPNSLYFVSKEISNKNTKAITSSKNLLSFQEKIENNNNNHLNNTIKNNNNSNQQDPSHDISENDYGRLFISLLISLK